MRKTLLIVFMAGLLFASCKSSVTYVDNVKTSQTKREIPYQQFKQQKPTGHVAIILPDDPDTINISQSAIAQVLKKNGYDIVIVNKPGKSADFIRGMDSRQKRIEDISSVFLSDIVENYQHYILIGIGEGAYVVPFLRHYLGIDTAISINMNPYSPLAGYEQWLIADSISSFQRKILLRKGNSTIKDLKSRIEGVKIGTNAPDRLSPHTNSQWMSYYNNPVYLNVMGSIEPFIWINFEQYPMISAAHQKEAALYADIPFSSFITLKGNGNLNNEEQMLLLVEKLKEILSFK